MTRPASLDLTSFAQPWREIDMPGANLGFEFVRLQSSGHAFVILGRFPLGFDRTVIGGYQVSEEFLVLDGALELEGRECLRGDLTFIPANFARGRMRSPRGCTVLAWFSGPAIFHPETELAEPQGHGCETVHALDGALNEIVLTTTESEWLRRDFVRPEDVRDGAEFVDLALTRWIRVESDEPSVSMVGPMLVRLRRAAGELSDSQ